MPFSIQKNVPLDDLPLAMVIHDTFDHDDAVWGHLDAISSSEDVISLSPSSSLRMHDKISILGHLESDETTMHEPRFPYTTDKTGNQEKRE